MNIKLLKEYKHWKKDKILYVDKSLGEQLIKEKVAVLSGADLVKKKEIEEIFKNDGAIEDKKDKSNIKN